MNQFSKCAFAALVGLCFNAGVNAQSTVGELLEKGGKQMTKEDFMQNLPARIQQ